MAEFAVSGLSTGVAIASKLLEIYSKFKINT